MLIILIDRIKLLFIHLIYKVFILRGAWIVLIQIVILLILLILALSKWQQRRWLKTRFRVKCWLHWLSVEIHCVRAIAHCIHRTSHHGSDRTRLPPRLSKGWHVTRRSTKRLMRVEWCSSNIVVVLHRHGIHRLTHIHLHKVTSIHHGGSLHLHWIISHLHHWRLACKLKLKILLKSLLWCMEFLAISCLREDWLIILPISYPGELTWVVMVLPTRIKGLFILSAKVSTEFIIPLAFGDPKFLCILSCLYYYNHYLTCKTVHFFLFVLFHSKEISIRHRSIIVFGILLVAKLSRTLTLVKSFASFQNRLYRSSFRYWFSSIFYHSNMPLLIH